MSDEVKNVVSFDRARRRPDPARVTEFAETARRLQRERQESGDVVTRALRDTPRAEWSRLASSPGLRNSGVLDRLGREVASRLERDPQEALALANLATSIAETLAADSYPAVVLAQMRAHAWKDRANVLSYLGQHEEAIQAVAHAERRLAPFATTAHDLAIARLVKAIALRHLHRFSEALAFLKECKAVFFDHGDSRRFLQCSIVEGNLLFQQKLFDAAREVYAHALSEARATSDADSEARLHNNLGRCSIELGDFTTANIHVSRAMALFNDLGLHVEAIQTELAFGRLFVARGTIASGMEKLRDAGRKFLMHGMVEDAAMCGLEMIEALLQGARTKEAQQLAREIEQQFTAAGLNERALAALADLREAIDDRTASTATVRQIHGYIASLRTNPRAELAL